MIFEKYIDLNQYTSFTHVSSSRNIMESILKNIRSNPILKTLAVLVWKLAYDFLGREIP
jgi:hypothetical protein